MAVSAPSRKVGAGLAVSSLIAIAVWVAKQFYGVEIPAAIALQGNALVTFIVQYVVPNAAEEPPSA